MKPKQDIFWLTSAQMQDALLLRLLLAMKNHAYLSPAAEILTL